jgi:hypothetical protein
MDGWANNYSNSMPGGDLGYLHGKLETEMKEDLRVDWLAYVSRTSRRSGGMPHCIVLREETLFSPTTEPGER